ncbi:MAG: small subunit ribosomal protein S17 [Candidatus Saganbacteria bacterium]|uniref:Small ribosomal subunit protein uS17 n=1 Tax=Candidatus Saganbacteria bacterium TaxID=2575572 RepID=A0A833L150_UNCSA|nr:MAG: small subunit ribosomal protein S17 [Candidatus Saganbacteria bacterium]
MKKVLREGIVVSKKTKKTVIVRVQRVVRHPQYQKVMKILKRYHVHDEKEVSNLGDVVTFMQTRPLSAMKRHVLVDVVGAVKVKEHTLPAKPRKEEENDQRTN